MRNNVIVLQNFFFCECENGSLIAGIFKKNNISKRNQLENSEKKNLNSFLSHTCFINTKFCNRS